MRRPSPDLSCLLEPRSVAVLGASDDPARIGGRPIAYLKAGGFAGRIFPVNPNRATVQGLPAYPSIDAVPADVDLAILALPARLTRDAVEACARKGVRGAVVFSSGFAEIGPEGAAMQEAVAAAARAGGMRLVGPNCLGLFNATSGLFATFTTTLDRTMPTPGPVSIVSQSGAFGSHLYWLARERGLGLRYWITTGNEADLHVAECLRFLAEDAGTRVVMAYAEGIKDGDLLVEALEAARRGHKPVVFMKVGRSPVGKEAAASHTAALAGEDAVYEAVLRQFGAHRAKTVEELVDVAHAATRGILPGGRRLGLVTISGGVGVLMADAAADRGIEVPAMPADAQRCLKELLPFASTRNPVDITAHAFNDTSLVGRFLEVMLEAGNHDAILAFFTSVPGSPALAEPVKTALVEACARHPDRLVILSMLVPEPLRRAYEASGLPVFEDPTRAVVAIDALMRFGASFARERASADVPLADAVALPRRPIAEHEAKALLASAGIPVPRELLARSPEAAVAAFRELGRPVVLKLASPDVPHKTEIGGVLLRLASEREVEEGFSTLLARARERAPGARVDGVLVAPMIEGGVETILGVKQDPVFGPVVMVGLGGILVEVLNDVALRRAPVDEAEARAMIDELRGRRILEGARGRPPADVAALARAVVALSRFAAANAASVADVDINPFVVLREGEGAWALDALVVPRPDPGE